MFHSNVDLDEYFYHYTTYNTALEYIFPTQSIRFSSIRNTNDPRESKEWLFSMSSSTESPLGDEFFRYIQDLNRLIKSNSKLLCLTRDNPQMFEIPDEIYGRSFSHSRMWAQYAGNHRGVCLIFNCEKLTNAIFEQISSKGLILHGPVVYNNRSRESVDAFNFKERIWD